MYRLAAAISNRQIDYIILCKTWSDLILTISPLGMVLACFDSGQGPAAWDKTTLNPTHAQTVDSQNVQRHGF